MTLLLPTPDHAGLMALLRGLAPIPDTELAQALHIFHPVAATRGSYLLRAGDTPQDTPMTAGRTAAKVTPELVATAFWQAFITDQLDVVVGRARVLLGLRRWVPSLAQRIMRHAE